MMQRNNGFQTPVRCFVAVRPDEGEEEMSNRIAELNDAARKYLSAPEKADSRTVRIVWTARVCARNDVPDIQRKVETYNAFSISNDPYGEHDSGSFTQPDGEQIYWKIDYYASCDMDHGSEDPSDQEKTTRVLTIMLASED
jgi:Protein of unknown function (DUF3768)